MVPEAYTHDDGVRGAQRGRHSHWHSNSRSRSRSRSHSRSHRRRRRHRKIAPTSMAMGHWPDGILRRCIAVAVAAAATVAAPSNHPRTRAAEGADGWEAAGVTGGADGGRLRRRAAAVPGGAPVPAGGGAQSGHRPPRVVRRRPRLQRGGPPPPPPPPPPPRATYCPERRPRSHPGSRGGCLRRLPGWRRCSLRRPHPA